MENWDDPLHLPRDPQKARIGWQRINPEASSCTPFWTADILNPDNNKTAPLEQIGYIVHAHCWVLVDRIIGFGLFKANLKIFLIAVEQFWAENAGLWCRAPWKYVGYETNSDPHPDPDPEAWTSETESEVLSECDIHGDRHKMPIWENPTIVPRIQEIIEQATRESHSDSRPRRTPSSLVSHVPLDIALQIVEMTKLGSIKDTRNMLAAFEWRLPDSYWKSRCKMDLIFEYADLQKTDSLVDWQFIGLATEELMEDPTWERNTGLGTRRWIFQYLEQIKTIFLDLLEREKMKPGYLMQSVRRKNPPRNRLL